MNDWGLGASPTVQYGTGASFQAQCPAFPPPPTGYTSWLVERDGPIPADIQAHATLLANDTTKPLGYTDTVYSGGVPLLLRVDAHTWTTDASGNAVAGCLHGCDVWIPSAAMQATASNSGTNRLLTLSIILGGVVSIFSIYEFLKK
jgi:hypothetical protein